MRVGLLGGTFDPPHRGHLYVARAAQRALGLDRVLFVPCQWQPLKPSPPVAPGPHRAAMVALAISARSGWVLETSELDRPGPSYTVETLRELRLRLPGVGLTLILGQDSFSTLDRWHRAGELGELCDIAVVPRSSAPPPADAERAGVRWIRTRPLAVSSTTVRERLLEGRDVSRLVPVSVEAYIRKEGLYGCPPLGALWTGGRSE